MSAYLGRRGLDQLREQLSERDLLVVGSVEQHRFLTARQVEEFHFAGSRTPLAGARLCRRVLARLTHERVLVRLERRVGGVRAGSASFVYALGPVGVRLVDSPRRRYSEPSPLFLFHTLAIADAHLELLHAARDERLELVEVQIEPKCWRRFVAGHGRRESVRPDLYAATAIGGFEDFWFVEIDRATESPASVRRKCQAYEAYWRTGFEQERLGVFPLVLWVAPDARRATRLNKAIDSTRNLKRGLFRVTTSAHLIEVIAGGAA